MPGKHVQMKPAKVWAAVDSKRGNVIMAHTDKVAVEWSCPRSLESGEVRLARVTITEGDGWLPIETAPKDGTVIIYAGTSATGKQWVACGSYSEGEGWHEVNTSGYDPRFEEDFPAHWMPLPAPPKARKK